MQYVTHFFFNFLVYDVNLISNSDTLYEAILQIESFSTLVTSFSPEQKLIINQAQNLLKLAANNLLQKVLTLNLTISSSKIIIFTSFQNKLQSISSVLTAINSNSAANISINATSNEITDLMQVVASFLGYLQSLGKLNHMNVYKTLNKKKLSFKNYDYMI